MKYLPELLFLTPLIALVFIALLLATETNTEIITIEQPRCETTHIPITNTIGFMYDECLGLVKHQYDTTWIEPGMFEIRRIRMEESYAKQRN